MKLTICLALILLSSEISGSTEDSEILDRHNCAVAITYAGLLSNGTECRLLDVESKFSEEFRDPISEVPMDEICTVMRKFGVEATPVKFDQLSTSSIPLPVILLIYPNGEDEKSIGHYVLLTELSKTDATLVDSNMLLEPVRVPLEKLSLIWRGHGIVFTNQSIPRWLLVGTIFMVLVAIQQLYATIWR